jgi:hypothetical protein
MGCRFGSGHEQAGGGRGDDLRRHLAHGPGTSGPAPGRGGGVHSRQKAPKKPKLSPDEIEAEYAAGRRLSEVTTGNSGASGSLDCPDVPHCAPKFPGARSPLPVGRRRRSLRPPTPLTRENGPPLDFPRSARLALVPDFAP